MQITRTTKLGVIRAAVSVVIVQSLLAANAPEQKENKDPKEKDPQEMAELQMNIKTESDFRPNTVSTATLTNLSPEDVPQTVNVITKELIKAKSATDLISALQMDSSVTTGGDTLMSRTSGQYSIRGFSGSDVLVNGVPLTAAMGYGLDTALVQNIEVVKGPVGSIAGGQSSALGAYGAGGSINLVMKRPEFEKVTSLTGFVRVGKDNNQKYRVELDDQRFTGDDSQGVALRTILTAQYTRPFWQQGSNIGQSYTVAPIIRWQHDKKTSSTLTLSYQYKNEASYMGVPVLGGQIIGKPDAWYGSPFGRYNIKSALTMYDFERKLDKTWTFRAGASMNYTGTDYNIWGISSSAGRGVNMTTQQYYDQMIATGKAKMEASWTDKTEINWNLYANALAEFSTGRVKHEALAGVTYTGKDVRGNSQSMTPTDYINLNDPITPPPAERVYTNATGSDTTMQKAGVLLQDVLTYEQWILLAGIRGDAAFSDQGSYKFTWSPRAGMTRKFGDRYALFGNVSRTSAPNFGYESGPGQELTETWRADQLELGGRMSPCDNVWFSASWFQIRQENAPVLLPNSTQYYYSDGSKKSQGVELSLNGNITENWSSYLSYTYTHFRNLNTGEAYALSAPNAVSLWQKYRVTGDTLFNNWVFGLGYRYRDSYFATFRGEKIANNYTIPSYSVFDFTIDIPCPKSWGLENGSFKVGVYNIFDKTYIQSTRHAVQCFVGEPRTFELGFTCNF